MSLLVGDDLALVLDESNVLALNLLAPVEEREKLLRREAVPRVRDALRVK